MTECERFVKEGLFTPDFFKPEVRCDFLVDEKRKKIWAVLLDLLRQFDDVCKRSGLRYYLFGGTLLGAIRHKGIIPWDDDIDVVMPREDYDRFLGLASVFPDPYHLQVPGVEPGYGYSFAKLRNVKTTASSDIFLYAPFNQGMFLDVFPLDEIDKDRGRELYDNVKDLCIDNSTCMRMCNPHLNEANLRRVKHCKRRDIIENQSQIDKLARQYNGQGCAYCGLNTSTIDPYEHNVFHKADFAESVDHSFEGFVFPIPIGYERILRDNFGDYMEFPPVSERGMRHSDATFLPDVPYAEYRARRIME